MTDIINELLDHVRSNLHEVDADKAYDEFLDECYSFKSIGGPFEYMQPSNVFEECDPTAYRCGFSDWLDGEDLVDIGVKTTEYYRRDDLEKARDSFIDDLEMDLEAWEYDLEGYREQRGELESDEDEAIGKLENCIEVTLSEINAVNQKIEALREYVF